MDVMKHKAFGLAWVEKSIEAELILDAKLVTGNRYRSLNSLKSLFCISRCKKLQQKMNSFLFFWL